MYFTVCGGLGTSLSVQMVTLLVSFIKEGEDVMEQTAPEVWG